MSGMSTGGSRDEDSCGGCAGAAAMASCVTEATASCTFSPTEFNACLGAASIGVSSAILRRDDLAGDEGSIKERDSQPCRDPCVIRRQTHRAYRDSKDQRRMDCGQLTATTVGTRPPRHPPVPCVNSLDQRVAICRSHGTADLQFSLLSWFPCQRAWIPLCSGNSFRTLSPLGKTSGRGINASCDRTRRSCPPVLTARSTQVSSPSACSRPRLSPCPASADLLRHLGTLGCRESIGKRNI